MADYTYASARVKALESALLSPSQVELLVTAKGTDELYTVLYDTYLASYLRRNTEQDILTALEEQIRDTKELLVAIAPVPGVLDLLWVKYDYHNLKVAVKGIRVGRTDEEILADCFAQGVYPATSLLAWARAHTFEQNAPELAALYAQAEKTTGPGAVDELCNAAYFARIRELAAAYTDPFATEYVRALIDLFNVKAIARGELRETLRARKVLIDGGVCPIQDTLDAAAVSRAYACYGGEARWRDVVHGVQGGAPVATLEKVADEAFSEWLKAQAAVDFGLANLVSYFHAVKNNAQIVSVISKAKRSGMSEKDLRAILRARHL